MKKLKAQSQVSKKSAVNKKTSKPKKTKLTSLQKILFNSGEHSTQTNVKTLDDVKNLSLIGNDYWIENELGVSVYENLDDLNIFPNLHSLFISTCEIKDASQLGELSSLSRIEIRPDADVKNIKLHPNLKEILIYVEDKNLNSILDVVQHNTEVIFEGEDLYEEERDKIIKTFKTFKVKKFGVQKTLLEKFVYDGDKILSYIRDDLYEEWQLEDTIPKSSLDDFISFLDEAFDVVVKPKKQKQSLKQIKNKSDFVKSYGEIKVIKKTTEILDECSISKRGNKKVNIPILYGKYWTTGFHNSKSDPKDIENWSELDKALQIAKQAEAMLKNVFLSSDIDCDFYGFVIPKKISTDNFLDDFKEALGSKVPLKNLDDFEVIKSKNKSIFYDIAEDEINEYFDDDDIKIYNNTTKFLRDNLESLREVKLSEKYITYPVFWLGKTKGGYWAGIMSMRSDT